MAQPNVLIVAIDSLRADALFGDHIDTPNADALAKTGAAFKQCVSSCTTTTPSFSSILTGCYPPKHGVRGLRGYRLSPSLTTMAEAFENGGYSTHAEVTGPLLPQTGVLRGFQEANHRRAAKAPGSPFFRWSETLVEQMRSYAQPWFTLLHTWEVHRPYRSPPTFAPTKNRAGYEAAVAATDEHLARLFDAARDNTVVVVTGDHGEEYADSRLELLLGGATRRLRRKVKLGRWLPSVDDKLAALEIGHGFALHEHLIRVPLIIGGAGVPVSVVDDQVRHVDLFPTLADICGLPAPGGIDGRSLRPLMEGGTLPQEPAYLEALGVKLEERRISAARTSEWKLLKRGGGKPALYRIDGERPDEKRNLYGRRDDISEPLEEFITRVNQTETVTSSGMTDDEERYVEQHLRDLGYL